MTEKNEKNDNIDIVCKKMIGDFFNILKRGEAENAISYLLETSNVVPHNDSVLSQTVEKLMNISRMSGSYIDNILLNERRASDVVIVYVYLVRYESAYYRFLFEFYNKKNVKVSRLRFDAQLEEEIEESLKLYM